VLSLGPVTLLVYSWARSRAHLAYAWLSLGSQGSLGLLFLAYSWLALAVLTYSWLGFLAPWLTWRTPGSLSWQSLAFLP